MDSAIILRAPTSVPGVYDDLFWGIFLSESAHRIAFYLCALTTLGIVWFVIRSKTRAAEGLALLAYTLLCYLAHIGLDELFVNLRHAHHLATSGIFSFNLHERIEGTVDFLPYFVLGLFEKIGIPLIPATLIQSWLGGLFCIFAVRRFIAEWLPRGRMRAVGGVLICFLPTLVVNAASGLTGATFTAAILWAIYFLFFTERYKAGLFLLSIIPTIRCEGMLVTILVFALFATLKRQTEFRKLFLSLFTITTPFLLLSLYRWIEFGNAIPVPIRFKAGLGNWSLFFLGIRKFSEDALKTGLLFYLALALVSSIFLWSRGKASAIKRRELSLIALLFLFILPYYLVAGGDWYPPPFARYLLPVSLFAFAISWSLFSQAASFIVSSRRLVLSASLGAAATIIMLLVISSSALPRIFAHLTPALKIQNLSKIGNFFRANSKSDDVIASSEVATIFYFADREGLDLLGVANPELARQPPLEHVNRLLHRRRTPNLVLEHLPQIVWAKPFPHTAEPFQNIREELRNINMTWQADEGSDSDYFGPGGIGSLYRRGYRFIGIIFPDGFYTAYLVSPSTRESHLALLKSHGFVEIP